jgi:hypothetical protein
VSGALYHVRVSPSTRLIPLLAGAVALLSGCGEPPQPLPTSPPYVASQASSAPSGPLPAGPTAPGQIPPGQIPPGQIPPGQIPPGQIPPGQVPTAALPTGLPPAYPGYPAPTTTATNAPLTKSPTPTPSHAAKCRTAPTGPQVLALIKGKPGIPNDPLRIDEGPFCAGDWSFTTVEITGKNADDVEPLLVVATGKGTTLTLVAAGSDVCTGPVQTGAPAGIRVLACGF